MRILLVTEKSRREATTQSNNQGTKNSRSIRMKHSHTALHPKVLTFPFPCLVHSRAHAVKGSPSPRFVPNTEGGCIFKREILFRYTDARDSSSFVKVFRAIFFRRSLVLSRETVSKILRVRMRNRRDNSTCEYESMVSKDLANLCRLPMAFLMLVDSDDEDGGDERIWSMARSGSTKERHAHERYDACARSLIST